MADKHAKPAPGLILMAEVMGAQGIRGAVKLLPHGDDPESLADYSALRDGEGEPSLAIAEVWRHGKIWLARFEGVDDRTAAEKLVGTKLYLFREDLPEIEEEGAYYHADLVGLKAVLPDGTPLGTVIAVANFGAGDLLDIKPAKGNSFYIPFTDAAVPEVDLKGKTVTVDPPAGLLD